MTRRLISPFALQSSLSDLGEKGFGKIGKMMMQNAKRFVKMSMPLSMLIILSMAVGYIFSFVFSFRKFRQKDKEINVLRKNVEELQKEIQEIDGNNSNRAL